VRGGEIAQRRLDDTQQLVDCGGFRRRALAHVDAPRESAQAALFRLAALAERLEPWPAPSALRAGRSSHLSSH
jgi:hypothetical protein